MSIISKIRRMLDDFYSLIKLRNRKKTILEKGVKVNSATYMEDNVKIYRNTTILSSSVGRGTYIGWNSILNRAKIGRFCSIAPFVEIIYGRHAINEFVSSHPCFYSPSCQAGFSFVKESKFKEILFANDIENSSVVIGNDVWIGFGVKILEGVTIGDGSIIGTGSIVTKDIEPYSINVGVPAKIIKYRFDLDTVEGLLNSKWWNQDFDWVEKNHALFDCPEKVIEALNTDV